jgi:formylglycine-generating enzyme required for sulfatase activity/DNA polymerase III delta prime subunit
MDRHVFISYRRSDSSVVDELVAALSDRFRCWRDTTRIAGGQAWREEITRALDAAYAMILVVSPETEQSKEVYAEYFYALGRKVPVIPLLVTECEVPFGLANVNARLLCKDYRRVIGELRSDLDVYRSQYEPFESASDFHVYLRALQLGYLMAVGNYTTMAGKSWHRRRPSLSLPQPVVMRPEFSLRRSTALFGERQVEEQTKEYEDLLPALREAKRVVLLGEPGIGKTTTLYKFADELLKEASEKGNAPIPLIVPLGEWRDDVTWETLISRHLGVLAPRYAELLASCRLFFLLDGLNEIPRGQAREKNLDKLRQLLGEDVPSIVTCRELDYRDEVLKLHLDTITIHPLDPPRVRDFLQRYLVNARGEIEGATVAEKLFWEIAGGARVKTVWDKWERAGETLATFFSEANIPDDVHKFTSPSDNEIWWKTVTSPGSLMRLAANPYLLWMFLQIYLEGGRIPSNRGALFDEFVFQLLKREGFSDGDTLSVEGQHLSGKLEDLAWAMQREAVVYGETGLGVEITIDRHEAIMILGSEQQLYHAASANLLEDVDPVRFTHQLLQEYFVGRRMLGEINAGRLDLQDFWPKECWWQLSGWEEATVLAVGMSGSQVQQELLERLLVVNPEVAALAIVQSGIECDDRLKIMLREILMPQIVDLEQHPQAGARAAIGRAIGIITLANGDPLDNRPGVGLTSEGLPDINWVDIPGGAITLEDVIGEFEVKPFRIARYLVTNRQFQAFVDALDGYGNPKWWKEIERSLAPSSPTWHEANYPRERVSWYEAVAFCRWLTEKSRARGLLKKSQEIRLPTEWEWQQAATKGNNYNIYPWGLKWDPTRCNNYESNLGRTSAVGIYPHGIWAGGPLDMAGNVFEWCLNKYENPKARGATKIDKSGLRVLRGGSWTFRAEFLRASDRARYGADFRGSTIGFRLAQNIS